MKITIKAKTEKGKATLKEFSEMKDLRHIERKLFKVLFDIYSDELPDKLVLRNRKKQVDLIGPIQMEEEIKKRFYNMDCSDEDFSLEVIPYG